MEVKIINKSTNSLPQYATEFSAGLDLRANIPKPILLKSLDRSLIPTGIFIELPVGYEAQIRPRSGLAAKHGITVLNSPGTIDSDYRGEINIILVNLSREDFQINPNERLAQMVINKFEKITWKIVSEFSNTKRGTGGFGHTGNT